MLLKRDGILLLTGGLEQSCVLRALGLAAAPVGPLASLTNERLVQVAAAVQQAQSALRKQQEGFGLTMVLACWNPGGWSAADQAELRAHAEFLAQVDRSRTIDMGEVAIWQPSEEEVGELDFAVDHGNRTEVWKTVRASVFASSYAVACYTAPDFERQEHPADYVEAMHSLQVSIAAEVRRGERDPRRAERLKRLSDLVERDLVTPLLRQASDSQNPLRRVLLTSAAELTRNVHLQSPELRRQLSLLNAAGPGGVDKNLMQQLAQQQRGIRDLIQITKLLWKD
ncbi:MAG: hypothetical protein IID41_16365 [Planctomycetes bacterium]|nr:hypothetical protein [Planctomycetota bacterium]